MGIAPNKTDKIIEENPYLLLGYGINSYFAIMLQLLLMMVLISSLAIPLMLYFATFSGTAGEVGHLYSQFTIGNLGGASTYCTQASLYSGHSNNPSIIL